MDPFNQQVPCRYRRTLTACVGTLQRVAHAILALLSSPRSLTLSVSIYQLKPRFQAMLRPLVIRLAAAGVTANQVTLLACAISVLLGVGLCFDGPRLWFALIPIWMLLRMALNAIDGMLAREFGQQSRLGALLNELTDVLADAALYLPFAWIAPFSLFWVAAVIWLATVSEMTGVLGQTIGDKRRYDGPMGKSDRAFLFGLLAIFVAIGYLPFWLAWVLPVAALLIIWNILNRARGALRGTT
jgi:CDP-diacylglycerol---glycerol-3-phosphate 3-phosphatidyltransferase